MNDEFRQRNSTTLQVGQHGEAELTQTAKHKT